MEPVTLAVIFYLFIFSGFILWVTLANMAQTKKLQRQLRNIILTVQNDPDLREAQINPLPLITLDDIMVQVWDRLKKHDRADLPKYPNQATWGEL